MVKVIGNKNTARWATPSYIDREQMKKVFHRAQKRAWELLKV